MSNIHSEKRESIRIHSILFCIFDLYSIFLYKQKKNRKQKKNKYFFIVYIHKINASSHLHTSRTLRVTGFGGQQSFNIKIILFYFLQYHIFCLVFFYSFCFCFFFLNNTQVSFQYFFFFIFCFFFLNFCKIFLLFC